MTCDSAGTVIRINLRLNNLVGTIPADIGSLHMVNAMNFNHNNLDGTIPADLGDLSQLGKFGVRQTVCFLFLSCLFCGIDSLSL